MIIAYCANRKIYPQIPTTLNSLLLNNPEVEKVYLFIEDDNIKYINHPKVEFINCNKLNCLVRKGFNCTKHFPYMAMTRCFLSKVLLEDKIIYLDIDTIVDGSLIDLWNLDFKGNPIAGRTEMCDYINSGVLLMDLNQFRKNKYDDKLMKLLKSCRFVFPDQDALNIVFKNKKTFIPSKFNVLGKDKVYEKEEEIIIRHFAGLIKPWKKGASDLDKEIWNKYYVESI